MKMRAAAIRLMARVLANSSRKLFDDLALPSVRGSDSSDAGQHERQHRGHQPQRRAEADELQQQAADEEAGALHGVLRAGEPGDPAEQLPGALLATWP